MLFGLRSEKPLLNRFQLAQPQRAQVDGTFDHKGNQSIALVLKDLDRAGEMFRPGSIRRSVCVYQETYKPIVQKGRPLSADRDLGEKLAPEPRTAA